MDELLQGLRSALADRYTTEREIGRGGMATVFVAEDRKHGRKVALKVLRPELVLALGKERFLSEIQITARLDHPHILPLLDSGEAEGFLYFVMPYVEGEALRDRLERDSQLPVDEAMQLTRELASALHYAHEHGVVHRDIKPANILVQSGHARLADFGIAHAVGTAGGDRLTATGMSVGTPYYMSPEQALGEKNVDARSDIYSLACVTYEMLAGAPPFSGASTRALLAKHLHETAPAVTTLRPEAGKEVATALQRALAKAPEDRPATAEEFAADLVAGARPPRRRRKRLARRSAIALGLAAVAVIAVGGAMLGGARDAETEVATGSIVFLPFGERGEVQGPFEGDSLSTRLALMFRGTERYRPVLPRSVREAVAAQCAGPAEGICGARVASDLGAQLYVHGTVTETLGDSIQVLAHMVDVTGERAIPSVVVEGSRDDPWGLLRELFRELAVAPATEGDRALRLAGVDTESPEALAAFLEGERLFLFDAEGATIRRAIEAFERAVQHDSTFALAWYRIAVLTDWRPDVPRALQASERALAYADQLSSHDQRMLQAHNAQLRGDADVAEQIYRELIGQDSTDVEALFQLGYLLWAYNWRRGRSMAEAELPLRKVLELSPRHPQAHAYLFHALAANEDRQDLAGMASLAEGSFETLVDVIRAIEQGDLAALRSAVDAIRGMGPFDVVLLHGMIGLATWRRDVADVDFHASVLRFAVDAATWRRKGFPPERRYPWLAEVLDQLARLEAGRGRWSEVRSIMSVYDTLPNTPATQHMALFASLPLARPPPLDVDSLRAKLEAWDTEASLEPPIADSYAAAVEIGCQVRSYLLGLLSVAEGDYERARTYANRVEACRPEGAGLKFTASEDLAVGLRADILFQQGHLEEALGALEEAPRIINYEDAFRSPFSSGHREVFLRARVLHELGRYEEALNWYSSAMEHKLTPALVGPYYYYRGEVHEKMGDLERAIWHYRAFLELWEGADPEYQYLADDIRGRLSRLTDGAVIRSEAP